MGKLGAKVDYEAIRNARIAQNQSRLASLGILKSVTVLRASVSPSANRTAIRKNEKRIYDLTSLRRSDRLKGLPTILDTTLRRSNRLRGLSMNTQPKEKSSLSEPVRKRLFRKGDDGEKRPANAPLLHMPVVKLSAEVLARRCESKMRGSVYDSLLGICCHFCRQKKLCGEEDCKRCGDGDTEQPCLGKTDCSVCHSSTGVFCRACLKVRYGEEMEEVRANKNWMCPHCIEEKGLNRYWICNSSICLQKRKISPTGIAIYEAREKGYKSVAHLLMDKLRGRLHGG